MMLDDATRCVGSLKQKKLDVCLISGSMAFHISLSTHTPTFLNQEMHYLWKFGRFPMCVSLYGICLDPLLMVLEKMGEGSAEKVFIEEKRHQGDWEVIARVLHNVCDLRFPCSSLPIG